MIDVPWKISEAIAVFLVAWIGLPILVWAILLALSPYLSLAHTAYRAYLGSNISFSFGVVVLDALVACYMVRRTLSRYRLGWDAVGLRRFNLIRAVLYVVGALMAFLILVALGFALVHLLDPGFNAHQAQVNEFTQSHTPSTLRLSFLALVVIPPFIEELTFRGFIFPALTKRFGIIMGAIITSVLFGIAHLQLNVSLYTLILSLLLCFMYYKLRSIWPGIALHMFNNYIAFVAIMHK